MLNYLIAATMVKETIGKLNQLGFYQTVDTVGAYSSNADLYYRSLDNGKYIVLNHYNKKERIDLQGFDCWLSEYENISDIGRKRPRTNECIKLSIQFPQDLHLITKWL